MNRTSPLIQRSTSNVDKAIHNDVRKNKSTEEYQLPFHFKLFRTTLYACTQLLNVAYVPLFIYRMFERPVKCPPIEEQILKMSATQLASKIRNREISCETVIRSYISRINEVNPIINAVIEDRFSEAIEEARKIDDSLESKGGHTAHEYPLLGVPVTIKGSFAVKGLNHMCGNPKRKPTLARAECDADVVALVRKSGAIPLLVSNVPELCMSFETTNKLIGTTNNPYDTTRTCGGSSGGEASLLASGASVMGIGSDISGSLRLPAHYCGIWSHKPTAGLVSFDGHYPTCFERDRWEQFFAVGPMTRYASDLPVLLDAIAKPEKLAQIGSFSKNNSDLKRIDVFYSNHDDFYWGKTNENCREAVEKVVDFLSTFTESQPKNVDVYFREHLPEMSYFCLLGLKDLENISDGDGGGVAGAFAEMFRYAILRSDHSFMPIACNLCNLTALKMPDKQEKCAKFLSRVKREIEEMLGENGVLIVPTFPTEAPKHGDVLKTALYAGYLSIFNVLGFPVTNCPVGLTRQGLPVGVQVVSVPQNDKLTLAVAQELEKRFGGWIEPS